MLKKIHSKRDPRDTLFSEINKEFSVYFRLAADASGRCLRSYPRLFYALILALMMSSLILSFTVFRHPEKAAPVKQQAISPVGDGFERIMRASEQIHQTIALKRLVDSLSRKNVLTIKDSVALEGALDRLLKINKPLNR